MKTVRASCASTPAAAEENDGLRTNRRSIG